MVAADGLVSPLAHGAPREFGGRANRRLRRTGTFSRPPAFACSACYARTHARTYARPYRTHAFVDSRTLARPSSGSVSLETERAERSDRTLYPSVVNNSLTVGTHVVLRSKERRRRIAKTQVATVRTPAGGREGGREGEKDTVRGRRESRGGRR